MEIRLVRLFLLNEEVVVLLPASCSTPRLCLPPAEAHLGRYPCLVLAQVMSFPRSSVFDLPTEFCLLSKVSTCRSAGAPRSDSPSPCSIADLQCLGTSSTPPGSLRLQSIVPHTRRAFRTQDGSQIQQQPRSTRLWPQCLRHGHGLPRVRHHAECPEAFA